MKSIKNDVNNTYIINKSKFICYLYKVDNLDEVNNYLEEIKNMYKDATHHCFAYIVDNIKRFSDDNEPGGTAGMPILNVLESNELNHILCIVVRYFGGIKLGAGGLVRAYTKSVTETLNNTEIKELIKGFKITIEFDYNDTKIIDNLLKECEIIDKSFDDKITYTFDVNTISDDVKKTFNIKNTYNEEIKALSDYNCK